ncbi:hypothetical protein [Azospirillum sp.]|uniref:hypothetical protein n=1 Tax=Azospirillum sp. TaxID=34012 RepID=UPI00260FF57D|nr:hypothetical protein [Azospirillum sp.]
MRTALRSLALAVLMGGGVGLFGVSALAAGKDGASALPPGAYTVVRPGMIFERPAVGAHGVAALAPGAAVTVLAAPGAGSWVKIRDAAGRVGYVTAGTLSDRWGEPPPPVAAKERGVIETAPVAEAAASPSAIASGATDEVEAMERRAAQAAEEARRSAERARAGGDRAFWGYEFPNGDRYDGSWLAVEPATGAALDRPRRHGFGVYRFAGGALYEGEWTADLMAGLGVMSFPDGGRYAGQFRDGQPDGLGAHHLADGGRSAGRWRAGTRQAE